jgi:hypothetical protein
MKITKKILYEMIEAEIINETIGWVGGNDVGDIRRLNQALVDKNLNKFQGLVNREFQNLTQEDWNNHPDMLRIFTTANGIDIPGWEDSGARAVLLSAEESGFVSSARIAQVQSASDTILDTQNPHVHNPDTASQNGVIATQLSTEDQEAVQKLSWIHISGVLGRGSGRTDDVKALQSILLTRLEQNNLPAAARAMKDASSDGSGVDGDFGGKTEAAVRALQDKWGIKNDGIVGKQTLMSLVLNHGDHNITPTLSRVLTGIVASPAPAGLANQTQFNDGDGMAGSEITDLIIHEQHSETGKPNRQQISITCDGATGAGFWPPAVCDGDEGRQCTKIVVTAEDMSVPDSFQLIWTPGDDIRSEIIKIEVQPHDSDAERPGVNFIVSFDSPIDVLGTEIKIDGNTIDVSFYSSVPEDNVRENADGVPDTIILEPVLSSDIPVNIEWSIRTDPDSGELSFMHTYGTKLKVRQDRPDLAQHSADKSVPHREGYDYFARITPGIGFKVWIWSTTDNEWIEETNIDQDYVNAIKPKNIDLNGGDESDFWVSEIKEILYQEAVNKKAGETILSEARFKKLAGI